jgi:uncharacterized protein (UPF0333 family)
MNTVLIVILVLIGGAALFVALSRCCGKAKTSAGAGGASEDFVEAANAASRAARHSLAEGLGSPLGGCGDRCEK